MQLSTREKSARGLWAISPPKCKKEPSKIEKEPLKIAIDCNCKSLFNIADLVNGMWKVAPENQQLMFGLLSKLNLSSFVPLYFVQMARCENIVTDNWAPVSSIPAPVTVLDTL